MQEKNGMRPLNEGISKVIIVITDGKSNDRNQTKLRANELKKREFNIVTIGVGQADLTELFELSTSSSDQYYLQNFDQILSIIKDITMTSCQKPSVMKEEKSIEGTVGRDSYRYFKYSLKNEIVLFGWPEFNVELEELKGQSKLFYSFNETNPKDNGEFLNESFNETNDENFYEVTSLNKTDKTFLKNNIMNFKFLTEVNEDKKNIYHIKNTLGHKTVFFSVKGVEDMNSFKINVKNSGVISSANNLSRNVSFQNLLLVLFLVLFINSF